MNKNTNSDIESLYKAIANRFANKLAPLADKIGHIHPNISMKLSQYRVDLLTGIQKNDDEISYKIAVEHVIHELGALSNKISHHQSSLSKEIKNHQLLLIKDHDLHQKSIENKTMDIKKDKMNKKIVVLSLSESARCLGVAQAKNDKGAMDYWTEQVQKYESLLLDDSVPSPPTKKPKRKSIKSI